LQRLAVIALKEVARYTTAADQERLADTAIRARSSREREQVVANQEDGVAKNSRNELKRKDWKMRLADGEAVRFASDAIPQRPISLLIP
jgi:hypothetical protein